MTGRLHNIQVTLGSISSITHSLPKQTKNPKNPKPFFPGRWRSSTDGGGLAKHPPRPGFGSHTSQAGAVALWP